MAILVSNLKLPITAPSAEAETMAVRQLGVSPSEVLRTYVAKQSVDARKKAQIAFVYSVGVELKTGEDAVVAKAASPYIRLQKSEKLVIDYGSQALSTRPVIAGFGPAGMFAGLLLAQHGYRPLILERGGDMQSRVQAVEQFWNAGTLNPLTNVQFGEGGAGTFSDGKLTTRIGAPRCHMVLQELVNHGAPEEILYKAKPHVGTDLLRDVVTSIRRKILELGGEIRFLTPVDDIKSHNSALCSVTAGGEDIPAEALILAIGHSARDTFSMLHQKGMAMRSKPFSVGVRIEHLQQEVDKAVYGSYAGHPALPKGEYQLSLREGEDAVYTFCMCPGGFVVPSASQPETVVTNGMSLHARDGKNANSALVASVSAKDYGNGVLDGIHFQQRLEQTAFLQGGKKYCAPVQTAGLFLEGKSGTDFGRVAPTFACGTTPANLEVLLGSSIANRLRAGIRAFDRRQAGFAAKDSVLTGVETRTSSPVRILREENFQSATLSGLFPCGEGAGYAGGIVSAAVDGIRCAQAVMQNWAQPRG